ncbi:MAG: TonB-dependent receptor, partial [Burkholderiaceae bacterium]
PLPGVPPAAQGWVFASTDVAHERARQGSLELRYASPVTDRVSWLAGLYHFSEDVDRDEDFVTRFSLMPAAGGNVSFLQDAGGSSQAVYGLVRAGLTTQLELEAGLRYTHDHKSIHQVARNNDAADAVPGIPLFPGQPYDIRAGDTWNPLTGQLGLNYRPLPTMLVYGNVARGFKAGAFPSQNNVVQNVAQATPAERVLSTELGVKAEWLERRLRTNLAVFDTDAQDLQLFRLDPQLRLLTFTEDASIRGIELDLAAIPLPGLQLGLTGSLLHARVDGGSNAGDALPRAPDAKFAARVQYGRAVAQGRAELGLVYQWTDSFETDVPNTRIMHVAGYHLIDARLAWTDAAGNLEVAAWGRNLGDVDHVVHTIAFLGNGFSLYGAPRTYGLSVTYRIH